MTALQGARHEESSIAVKALENEMQRSGETRGTKIVPVAYPVRDLASVEPPTARDRSWDLTKKIQNIFGISVIGVYHQVTLIDGRKATHYLRLF